MIETDVSYSGDVIKIISILKYLDTRSGIVSAEIVKLFFVIKSIYFLLVSMANSIHGGCRALRPERGPFSTNQDRKYMDLQSER